MRKILIIFLFALSIFCLIPLIWKGEVSVDLALFTTEWYKIASHLFAGMLGFLFFDYLIKRNELSVLFKSILGFELDIKNQIIGLNQINVESRDFVHDFSMLVNFILKINRHLGKSKRSDFIDRLSNDIDDSVINSIKYLSKQNNEQDIDIVRSSRSRLKSLIIQWKSY